MALTTAEAEGKRPPIDLDRLAAVPLARDPYDHLIVRGFLPEATLAAVHRDFPALTGGGSHTPWLLRGGPAFRELLGALRSRDFARAMGAKFALPLEDKATLVTVRAHSRPKDGRIHRDSETKILTVLLYLNDSWGAEAGRLRLLRQPHDLDDYAVEVPPEAGTLLAFRCTPEAWHGHKPFVGPRRALQLNWMTGRGVAVKELLRHSLSDLTRGLQRRFKLS